MKTVGTKITDLTQLAFSIPPVFKMKEERRKLMSTGKYLSLEEARNQGYFIFIGIINKDCI